MNDTPPSPAPEKVLRPFGWFMVVFGGFLLAFGVFFLLEGSRSRTWPATEGTVVRTRVRWSTSSTQQGKIDPIKDYHYEVTYRYEVNGVEHTGDRYALGPGSRAGKIFRTDEDARAEAQARFPRGSALTVYVDPEDPTSAVLRTGADWGTWVPSIMGLIFLPVGILFLKSFPKA